MSNTTEMNADKDSQGPSSPAPGPEASAFIPSFLSPERVLDQLTAVRSTQPVAAIATANQYQKELTGPFLEAIEKGLANPAQDFVEHGMLFNYAAYFLAKWREPRAYPLFIRWLSLPGENAFELGGDTVPQHGARFLAAVCGTDLEPIKQLVLNREAQPACRGQALKSLGVLTTWNERPREEVEEYYRFLAREGLEREKSPVWHYLVDVCVQLEFLGVFPELRRALAEGLVEERFVNSENLDQVEQAPRGILIEQFTARNRPITDVIEETRWWAGFGGARNRDPGSSDAEGTGSAVSSVHPYVAPPRVGRNDPCPCGSGKKFKKCHGQ